MKKTQAIREASDRKIIVLDPNLDPKWKADFITHDAEAFIKVVKQSQSCLVVVDESGESGGQYKGPLDFVATRGRHWGHMGFFIGQRITQVNPNIRTQCANFFIFAQAARDCQLLSDEVVDNTGLIANAHLLNQGEFIEKIGFSPAVKKRLF
jgi:hypothetical protein